jgi:hypothetical protein
LDFTALPSFVASRYLLISPSRHLLLHHDIFVFTETPFFRRFTILSDFHELLLISKCNTGLSRATSQHVVGNHAAVVASAAGRC